MSNVVIFIVILFYIQWIKFDKLDFVGKNIMPLQLQMG